VSVFVTDVGEVCPDRKLANPAPRRKAQRRRDMQWF
jgi:hypothetical protein